MSGHSNFLLDTLAAKTRDARRFVSAAALAAVLGGPAFASDVFDDPVPGDGPALYEVRDDDTTIYLYGTFHLLPPGTEWRGDAFDRAMAATDHTIIEADVHSAEAQAQITSLVQQLGMNPQGVRLTETLGPSRTATLQAIADRYGLPLDTLEPLRPWLAVLTLTQIAYAQAGFDPSQGVETIVLARAAEEGDSLGYLETAAFQIRALAGLDEEQLLASFDVGIEDIANIEQQTLEAVAAWRVGDIEELDSVLLDETREIAPGVYEAVFAVRNRTWADQISTLLDDDQDAFIAVGAGHLYGPDNVISLLVDRGITVERIQ